MPAKHITDGKVTYIHGATPRRVTAPDGAGPRRPMSRAEKAEAILNLASGPMPTLDFLEAAERDALRIGEFPPEGLRVRPDEPSVQVYYGMDIGVEPAISALREPDEYDVWVTDQRRAAIQPPPVDWPTILGIAVVLTLICAAIFGIVYFAQFYDFSDFPNTILTTR